MNRTTIIQHLIDLYGYKRYLEIGVRKGVNFNAIKCDIKIGVDKDLKSAATVFCTSDKFFETNAEKFDLIFIDGSHEEKQVRKDIKNALHCLNSGGTIVIHDCNPSTEEMQIVPRKQKEWTGDVWKAFVTYRALIGLTMKVVNCDYGVGIIQEKDFDKEGEVLGFGEIQDLTYEKLDTNRKQWLNLISEAQFYITYSSTYRI